MGYWIPRTRAEFAVYKREKIALVGQLTRTKNKSRWVMLILGLSIVLLGLSIALVDLIR